MPRFVLIHGSWQGAWCWREIVPRLMARGHDVLAIDLPGHGDDGFPVETVSFQHYVNRLLEAVSASSEKSILVGHSMGGAVITQTAELIPDRVRALVSIAALIPAGGQSLISYVEAADPEYLAELLWAADRRTARISAEGVRRFLYSRCPEETIAEVLPLFTPEPVAPFETKLSFDAAALRGIPRHYIECLQDRVVPLPLQRALCAAIPSQRIYSLDTDHAPFFSMPEDLAAILNLIAEQV